MAEESEPGEEMPMDMGSLVSLEGPLSGGVRGVCAGALDRDPSVSRWRMEDVAVHGASSLRCFLDWG